MRDRQNVSLLSDLPGPERLRLAEIYASLSADDRAGEVDDAINIWEELIADCRGEYPHYYEDFAHGLFARELIEKILDRAASAELATFRAAIQNLDREFLEVTTRRDEPIFAEKIALSDPKKYFFYFRFPAQPGNYFK